MMDTNNDSDYDNDNMPIRQDHEDALRGHRLLIDSHRTDNTNV